MSNSTRESIRQALADHPGGVGMGELERLVDVNRRTILRHLNELIDAGTVRREGRGRATRYSPVSRSTFPDADVLVAEHSAGLQLSSAAKSALAEIQRPLTGRQPVGYEPSFLLDYRPGVTRYLDDDLCDQLRSTGMLAGDPLPAGTYARRILDRLLIDLSWNSSRLEGNTYSLLETERLLEAGIEAPERDPVETQMILNHKASIEFLVESAEDVEFDRMSILNLHALLSENLLRDPADGGRLRRAAVGIGGSVYEPLQNPHLIEQYFDEFLSRASAIENPFEQAFFALVHVPYLQPFIDVNKRVSRLAANIPFVRENLCPLSFIDVSSIDYAHAMLAVYEQNDVSILRDVFAWAYQRSAARYSAIRGSLGEPDLFRLRRRGEIKEAVASIIRARLTREEAARFIEGTAANLPDDERARFAEVVDEELASLHEGNFLRYQVRPSEFRAWREVW